MSAVIRKARRDLRRRKLAGVVVAFVVFLSTLAGTVALDLLVESDAPFDTAFASANGAHLTMHFDGAQVSDAQLRATAALGAVSGAAGPWHERPLEVSVTDQPDTFFDVVGRTDPGGPVDDLQVTSGRWVARTGEVVLSRRAAEDAGVAVGQPITAAAGQGIDSLTVVGIAASVNDVADAWVEPSQLSSIHATVPRGKGPAPPVDAVVMMYRMHDAATTASIQAASNQIAARLPATSVLDSNNWLQAKLNADVTTSVMIPFLIAFSVFGLLAAAVIIGNVVSGAVIAGNREIGVMKSIGFTPAQVVGVFLLQAILPAVLGAIAGVVAGTAASQPFLAQTADAFNLPTPSPLVPAVLAAGVIAPLLVVMMATILPALRAARMSAAEAIASASTPQVRRGFVAARLLARLPIPRALSLGAADAIARPVRSGMTLVAVVIGIATITFATGLTASLDLVKHGLARDNQVQVRVVRDEQAPPGRGSIGGLAAQTISDAQLVPLIQRQPGTDRFVAEAQTQVHVSGLSQPIPVFGYRGDASWIGYVLINGRWFSGSSEAVAPTAFFATSGRHIGNSVRLIEGGHQRTVRLVGEIFDQSGDNILLRTDWSTLIALDPGASPHVYEVSLSGTSPRAYQESLSSATDGYTVGVETTGTRNFDVPFLLIESALGGVAFVLTLCALLGVFNTVVLNTREKARDTAILKALGMTPRQVTAMVLTSVTLIGAVAAAVGIPAGITLHHQILVAMGRIATATAIPSQFFSVFPIAALAVIAVAGVAVAIAGALLPASWAARARISALLAPE